MEIKHSNAPSNSVIRDLSPEHKEQALALALKWSEMLKDVPVPVMLGAVVIVLSAQIGSPTLALTEDQKITLVSMIGHDVVTAQVVHLRQKGGKA